MIPIIWKEAIEGWKSDKLEGVKWSVITRKHMVELGLTGGRCLVPGLEILVCEEQKVGGDLKVNGSSCESQQEMLQTRGK